MAPFAEQIFALGADLARTQAQQLKAEPPFRETTEEWGRTLRANNVRVYAEFARLKRARGLL